MSLGEALNYAKDLITGKEKIEDAPLLHLDEIGGEIADNADKIGKATADVIYSTLDMLTGGGLTDAASEWDDSFVKRAEKLGLELRDLENIRDRLATELNKLEVDLSQVEDPSAYMTNLVQNSLNGLGFVNSKKVVNLLNKRYAEAFSAREKEIKDAHDSFVKKKQDLSDAIDKKRKDLDQAESDVRSKQAEFDKESNKSNTKKVLS